MHVERDQNQRDQHSSALSTQAETALLNRALCGVDARLQSPFWGAHARRGRGPFTPPARAISSVRVSGTLPQRGSLCSLEETVFGETRMLPRASKSLPQRDARIDIPREREVPQIAAAMPRAGATRQRCGRVSIAESCSSDREGRSSGCGSTHAPLSRAPQQPEHDRMVQPVSIATNEI